MRSMLVAGTAALLFTGAAYAQPAQTPDTKPAPSATTMPSAAPAPANKSEAPANPPLKTDVGNNPGAPVAGANSFTEGQAKARIESRGYTNVSALAKDKDGIWRGKADKDGKSVDVSLDYQGNVVVR